MTPEERFGRIEHVTASLAEERRKDREEYRQLWRETQRQINANSAAIGELRITIAELRDAIRANGDRAQHAEQELRDRIAAMVSGIGELAGRQ